MRTSFICGILYFILMKFFFHRTDSFVEAEALAVGVFIVTLNQARARFTERKHSVKTGGESYRSFAEFIDLSNTYTTASRLLSLTIIFGLLSAFFDVAAVIMLCTHDNEHLLSTSLMGVFFAVLTIFAAYQLYRKRHANKSH